MPYLPTVSLVIKSPLIVRSNTLQGVREEARPLKLNSGVVEKLVNSRWNSLSTSELEEYETQAAEAMELYNVELEKYKGTESYRDYQRYMAEYQESRKRHYEQQAATPPEPHVTSFIT